MNWSVALRYRVPNFVALVLGAVLALLPATALAAKSTVISGFGLAAAGFYHAGDQIEIRVDCTSTVTVTGTPRLVLGLDGGLTAYANYIVTERIHLNQVTFLYTVQPGQNASAGLLLRSIDLNGGTILDPGSRPVILEMDETLLLPVIDTTAPTVTAVRRHLPAEPNTTASAFVYRVSFSEPVAAPATAAFQFVRSAGISGGTIDWVHGSDTEWYVSISGVTAGYGTLRLNILGNLIADLAGNLAPAFSAGETYGRLGADPVAWGSNNSDQIDATGDYHAAPVATPTGAIGSQTIAFTAMGRSHSLVLTREGNLFAWGNGADGKLGNLSNNSSPTPTAVAMIGALSGQQVAAIAAGTDHNVVLSRSGVVFTWGANTRGQLGKADTASYNQPVYVEDSGTPMAGKFIVAISAGHQHTLALSGDGQVFAWGANTYGQLGCGGPLDTYTSIPVAVDTSGVLAGKHIVAISAGYDHCLALSSDGQLYAWGANSHSELGITGPTSSLVPVAVPQPPALVGRTIVEISAGLYHNLLRTADNRLFAWGGGQSGELGISSGLVVSAAAPTPVIMTGALAGRTVVAIEAGASYSRALTADGAVFTWGYNSSGQLGKGTTDAANPAGSPNNTPAPVSTNLVLAHSGVVSLGQSSTAGHSLALAHPRAYTYLLNTGSAGTYGAGAELTFHLLFSEAITVTGSPVLRLGLANRSATATYISGSGGTNLTFRYTVQPGDRAPAGISTIDFDPTGASDRFGLDVDYALPSGANLSGLVIDARSPLPLALTRSQPHAVTEAAAVTTAGALLYRIEFDKAVTGVDPSDFTLATTGTATGMIANVLGTGDSRSVVVTGVTGSGTLRLDLKSTGTGITDTIGNPLAGGLSTGEAYYHVATTALDGWGYNNRGQVGFDTGISNVTTPATVPAGGALTGKTVASLATGFTFSLALCTDGTLAAWGDNNFGQLGSAYLETNSATPVAVSLTGALSGKTVIAVAAGGEHCLALTHDGLVYAWGRNDSGQLGTSSGGDRDVPAAVDFTGDLAGKSVVAIAAGTSHSLALTADGLLFAWGSDTNNQLGNGPSGSRTTPTAVVMTGDLAGQRVVAVVAGGGHSLALDNGGRVYAWGSNASGQLGNGSYANADSPVALPAFTSPVVALAAGEAHSVALTLDGGLFAWGSNDRYQLGTGSSASLSRTPVAVDLTAFGVNTPVALAAGNRHNFAHTADGALFGWGDNYSSQLGSSPGYTVATPTRVNSGVLASAALATLATGCRSDHSLVLANVSGDPLALAERWRVQYFGTPFNTGFAADAADPDTDGRTNFVEYALGSNPINADNAAPAALALSGTGAARRLTLTFNRILDPALTYTVEASDTLAAGSWTSITPPATPLTGPVTVTDPDFMNGHTRRFLRLKIVRTP